MTDFEETEEMIFLHGYNNCAKRERKEQITVGTGPWQQWREKPPV